MFNLSFSNNQKNTFVKDKRKVNYSCKTNRSLIHCCNFLQSLCNVFNDFCTPLNTE